MCNALFEAVNNTSQTVLANGNVAFATVKIANGIKLQNNSVIVPYRGIYYIIFSADVMPAATGELTITIRNNNDIIATSTINATEDITERITIPTLLRIRPSCCVLDNAANITVTLSAEGTVTNADIIVMKVR